MFPQKKTIAVAGIIVALLFVACGGAYYYLTQYNSMPNLDRPFEPRADLPESIREESRQKVATAIEKLKADPSLINNWLEVAVYRKSAGDYQGAEEIWKYLTVQWPQDTVAYNNLADLYQNYLNRPGEAEYYWRKFLSLVPTSVPAYRNLHDLYRTRLNDLERAEAILEEGLSVTEEARDRIDLLVPLAIFQRDHGKLEEARENFDTAKQMADFIGKVELAGLLQAEIEKLP